jgi:MFS family permease
LNSIALHILSCHVPFVGGIFVLALLLLAWRRREPLLLEVAEYGVIAVALGSAIAWASGPASLTALEVWVDSAGRDHADRHAGIGEMVMVVWGLAAFAALWGVILGRASRPSPRWHTPLLLTLVILGIGLAAWAGHEGGRIRHTELRDAPDAETSAATRETADR